MRYWSILKIIIDVKTFILQLVYIVLASPSNLVLKNQHVLIILTRSLTLHMALEAVLLLLFFTVNQSLRIRVWKPYKSNK